jgi:aminoglycoside 6-adenylyltransferase
VYVGLLANVFLLQPSISAQADKRGASVSSVNDLYEGLVERFVKWAETRADIRAAIIIGSRARVVEPADDWADLDIIVVTNDPEYYVGSAEWLGNFGTALLTFVEPTASGDELERRAMFEGMLDVDFSIVPLVKAHGLLEAEAAPAEVVNSLGRGMRVIVDKDGIAGKLEKLVASAVAVPVQAPSQGEFLQVVNDFLYHAVFTAKHLLRGELWWAKMSSDCYMQHLLLRMIEWHARAKRGWNYETWFRGRFLEKWADPEVLSQMRDVFSHYDEADVEQGLLAAISLFRVLALETAERLGYSYPREANMQVTEWIRARFQK